MNRHISADKNNNKMGDIMQLLSRYCFKLLLLFAALAPHYCNATSNSPTQSSYNITHTSQSIVIDGVLDDPAWQDAIVISLDIVNSPWNNKKSPVVTTAKMIENGEYIYISFVAQDPNPESIQAFLGDRDSRWGDDLVGIKFDTFNSRRLSYAFLVNPFGVQHDRITNEMTGIDNNSWNGIWDSYGKITKDGYQVELAIPYRILNFDDTDQVKTWAFELLRTYPRDTRLRISHVPIDRNNDCWLCQYPEISGFKDAKVSDNIMVTPAIVASQNETKDIFIPNDDWHSDSDVDGGIDLRWGVNANTLLNVTLNPDFSTVEVDAGQLNINKTYSLFYDEKRAFFLENSEYFSSNYDLVYTRNIVDPDYGVKLTGTDEGHNYGAFVTNDTETNFFIPGNTGSDIASLNTKSHSAAFKYRYDFDSDLSVGAISTIRKADNYHNYVVGLDSKYKLNDSNTFSGQLLSSNTQYPSTLYKDFCYGDSDDDCDNARDVECIFGNCQYTEQTHRTDIDGDFSGTALKAKYEHSSEFWNVTAEHQQINANFRADLGYMPKVDYKYSNFLVDRMFYFDHDSSWQDTKLSGQWEIKHNEKGELLEKALSSFLSISGPMQSNFDFTLHFANKVGLRHDESNLSIDDNTTLFSEKLATFYGGFQPTPDLFIDAEYIIGKQIDYRNNRLGDYQEFYSSIEYNFNSHLETELIITSSELDADGANVYQAVLTELRVSYQFDVHSYLKFTAVHSDIDRNPNNNPYVTVSKKNKNLSTQLIYAYKLNPQTVFYLGYSDNSYQNDYINDLEREQRTVFTKISYAWMP